MDIHPSALVSPKAELGEGVKIGPFSIIGDNVSIGSDTDIGSHVVIEGNTQIGKGNKIYPFVTIGTPPQDTGYKSEDTRVIIGDKNIIREYATVHRATTKEKWETVIGNNSFLMAYSHVAHDCRLGNNVILANAATLGGHISIGDHAYVGGLVAVHQSVRIGDYAYAGGFSGIDKDVPPFILAGGPRARLYGINHMGLKRLGFSKEIIGDLKKAYRIIWRDSKVLSDGVETARKTLKSSPELEMLLNFLVKSKRGITR
ncbi:MAG: acyl-ACP--UDP-N-acetylglucosamine O-acyltransferase [Desulfobacterales bacterium]|nr:acyl-ACP--UDP-N-acetylglucosamine O-acyltransferase [Desulfobacterales bacterium]